MILAQESSIDGNCATWKWLAFRGKEQVEEPESIGWLINWMKALLLPEKDTFDQFDQLILIKFIDNLEQGFLQIVGYRY